jgi:hypothetical protein
MGFAMSSRHFVCAKLVAAALAGPEVLLMWRFQSCTIATIALLLSTAGAFATPIFIPNGNFGLPEEPDDTFSNTVDEPGTAVTSWTFFNTDNGSIAAGVWDPIDVNYTGTTGNNTALPGAGGVGQTAYIYLEQLDDLNPQPLGGRLSIDLGTNVASNFIYTLTVAIADPKTIDYNGSNVPVTSGDVTIRLLAGGDVIAMNDDITTTDGTFNSFSTFYQSLPANDPHLGMPLTIELLHTYSGVGFREADFANVRLDATFVPEPNSAALGFIGIAAIFVAGRRAGRQACD